MCLSAGLTGVLLVSPIPNPNLVKFNQTVRLNLSPQLQKTNHTQSVEDVMKKSVINIYFKHWTNSGMSTACDAATAGRHSVMTASVSFATETFFATLIFFGRQPLHFPFSSNGRTKFQLGWKLAISSLNNL